MAANPAAILAGAKAIRGAAIPGAATPTSPPQGANIGQISPLAASLANERGYANTYGPFLSRPPRTFTSGAFGPFSPILPVPVDEPDEGAQLPDPRLFEYLVGWNLPVGRPGTEGIKLADFSTLKTLADLYSVARAAIQIRKNEIVGLDWEIAPTKDAAKAYHGDKSAMKDFGGRRGQVMKFFKRPDPDYFSFGTWLSSLLEEVFVYDALSLIIRPKRGKNLGRGILGSNLDCIELISGPTIRPLLGMHGEVPRPPCYSEDTEVLTREGWKLFRELKGTEEVATRSESGIFEWQQPSHYVDVAYEGSMVHFTGRSIDCLVTPDHRMLTTVGPDGWSHQSRVRDERGRIRGHADGKDGTQREWITSAQRLLDRKRSGISNSCDRLVATSTWPGRELSSVTFTTQWQVFTWADGGRTETAYGPDLSRDVRDRAVVMSGDQYAAFMGAYLSEGSLIHDAQKYGHKFGICQTQKGKGWAAYAALIESLFGPLKPGKEGWTIWRKALWRYLQPFGYAQDKYAPPEILNLSRRQLEVFWHYYWLGDGGDAWAIGTSSPRMADCLQEIAQKIGRSSSVTWNSAGCYSIRARRIAYPEYKAQEVGYAGRVYCVTVPNGVVYVRRNGRVIWSGNSPAYQQYLYGVPRSDYMTMITERDLERAQITDQDMFREFTTDQLLYLPMVPRRWTPYGFPPVERALIPVMSGLQKQAFQLDYFREGTIPAVYISPGDVNMTPNQIRELQDALNAFAGDPAWHHKVIVLPPGSRVDPQKPTDVADQFDEIVMTQVVQAFDVNPMELGIIPKVSTVASPFAAREMAQTQRTIHERISTKPLLKYLCDIFNGIIQNYLGQHDMKFTFEGLQEEGEQGALTDLLVKQVQSGIRSVDEARDILELQPWNIPLTSGPIVMTAAGPVPFGMIMGKPGNGGHSPGGDQGGAPTPSLVPVQQTGHANGEPAATPGHAAAQAALAGSRTAITQPTAGPPSGSVSSVKMIIPAAVKSELEALQRHLRKGRLITSWEPRYIPPRILSLMAENIAKGLPVEQAIAVAKTIVLGPEECEGSDAIQIAG